MQGSVSVVRLRVMTCPFLLSDRNYWRDVMPRPGTAKFGLVPPWNYCKQEREPAEKAGARSGRSRAGIGASSSLPPSRRRSPYPQPALVLGGMNRSSCFLPAVQWRASYCPRSDGALTTPPLAESSPASKTRQPSAVRAKERRRRQRRCEFRRPAPAATASNIVGRWGNSPPDFGSSTNRIGQAPGGCMPSTDTDRHRDKQIGRASCRE